MGKFDGMDPKLVRDLLTEVKHAVAQMRAVEDRVRLEMSRAGLSTQTTHRPAQVADAAEEMVRDVNARLAVLEKRVDPPGSGAAPTDEPKETRGDRDRYENPRAGEKPDQVTPKDDDVKTGEEPKTGSDGTTGSDGKTGSDGTTGSDGKTGSDGGTGSDGKTGSDGGTGSDGKTGSDGGTGSDGKTGSDGGTGSDGKTGSDGGTGSDGKTGSDGGTGSDGKTCDDADGNGKDTGTGTDKDTGTGTGTGTGADPGSGSDGAADTGGSTGDQPADQPKDDDLDSRRERGAEADGGGTDTGGAADTPAKDHPDDTDVTKPQVVVVDGVKVLQIPLDPPTAEQLEDLLENTDKVQPAEMPKMPADTTAASNVNAWANDGSDVVSADTTPPDLDALKTVIEDHRDIQPHDMPGVEVPAGEYGKGQWAERDIRPDGDPGSIAPGVPTSAGGDQVTLPPASTPTDGTGPTAAADGTGPTATAGGGGTTGAYPVDGYGSAGVTPIDDPSPDTRADDACGSSTDRPPSGTDPAPGGKDTTPDGPQPTPDGTQPTPDGTQPAPGAKDTTLPAPDSKETTPDGKGGTPDGTPGGTGSTPDGTGATPGGDTGVRIPPTPPAGEAGVGTGAAPEAPGTGTADKLGTTPNGAYGSAPTAAYDVAAVAETDGGTDGGADGGAEAWASDDSDVVSIDVPPPDLEALRTMIENHRDIQRQEMPSVQVPPGEYGKGAWAPEDIRPDGPPGTVDPGSPERSA